MNQHRHTQLNKNKYCLVDRNPQINSDTVILGDVSTPFSQVNRLSRHKLNRETLELNEIIAQRYLKPQIIHLKIKNILSPQQDKELYPILTTYFAKNNTQQIQEN